MNLCSKNEEFSEKNRRQTRKPKPDVFFSDDSDEEDNILNKPKSLSHTQDKYKKKSKTRVTKSITILNDDSDSETNPKHVPWSSQEQLLQDKVSHSKLKKPVTKPDSNDSDNTCKTQILSTPRKQKLRISDYDVDQVNCVSPPKQMKTSNGDVPRTPQHKKTEQPEEAQTPSKLLVKLQLNSPTHQDTTMETGRTGSNRKELFKDNEKMINENAEHCSRKDIKKTASVYQNARKALDNTFATDLPGREKEINELRDFIKTHIENKTAGSLYISGPPGTGKTASLNIILQDNDVSYKFFFLIQSLLINTFTDIFGTP